jgi:hypothetical protein
LKEQNGELNYDRVEELVKRYQARQGEDGDSSEQPLQQFSSRAIQISKGLYLKADTPYGGNIDPALNRYVESSSEDGSDVEVMEYLRTLSESDRDLLLKKLKEKENGEHRSKRRKHVHRHRHHSHSK